eukprot:Phypoly_transcript_11470.p1 GENE.Phypoly_transcript_11470~~Phypoly_transcript_11470.p1  ORF type:complete len:320 (+),score=44.92 Phypoly_transcript_11470:14-973(+)
MRRALHYTRVTPSLSIYFGPTKSLRFASSLPPKVEPKGTKETHGPQKGRVEIQTKEGRFRGLTVLEDSLPTDTTIFNESLADSMEKWRNQGYRGVWLKITKDKSHLIPACLQNGFEFHHAAPNYVMLASWLPRGEASRLPHYADHSIGCGGAVINDKNEILLVTEAHSPEIWKIPGGMLNTGEEIPDGAMREVFEETGVTSTFESLLGFRHTHNSFFGSGNIYSICLLRATSQQIKIDPHEIDKCKWFPLQDFYNMKDIPPIQQAVAQLIKDYLHTKNTSDASGWKDSPIKNTITGVDSKLFNGARTVDLSHLSIANQK